MEWLQWLGDLSPIALFVIVMWIMANNVLKPMLNSHKETIERITRTQEASAKTMRDCLDANTEAIKESVDHNERIITNHLSKEVERDAAIISEMRAVSSAIENMNRKNKYDQKSYHTYN